MTWTNFKEDKPPLRKKVLVWRFERKKYAVARMAIVFGEDSKEILHWVNEQGAYCMCHDEDAWMTFEYIKRQTEVEYS